MDDVELEADIKRSYERRQRFAEYLARALVDPDNKFDFDGHPFPWTAAMVVWDGPGVQFMDARGKPVLGDLLRDPDDAAILLDLCNTMGGRGQSSQVRE
jgi:hypothetical protein